MTNATATPTTEKIASDLVEMCRRGEFEAAINQYYCKNIVSIEAMAMDGKSPEIQGLEAVLQKSRDWNADNEVHSMEVSDALVSDNEFVVRFKLDTTMKSIGQRIQMSEIAVYEVKDGKITRERFVYGHSPEESSPLATTEKIAQGLVELCRQGKLLEATQQYYGNDIVSIEPKPMGDRPAEIKGLDAVLQKSKDWEANTEVHRLEVSDPLVSDTEFAVCFKMDATCKQTNQRMDMSELAIYEVKNGKIVRERFVYGM